MEISCNSGSSRWGPGLPKMIRTFKYAVMGAIPYVATISVICSPTPTNGSATRRPENAVVKKRAPNMTYSLASRLRWEIRRATTRKATATAATTLATIGTTIKLTCRVVWMGTWVDILR